MDIFKASEKIMKMDDAAWARHANPWSVWSRFSCLPLIVAAIWCRIWIGWWALVPLGLALIWTWINPRLFAPPAALDSWASRGVMGERFFLNRHEVPVPEHHLRAAWWLTAVSAAGLIVLIAGLWIQDGMLTLFGLVVSIGGKMWFVDRMVWIYEDMTRSAGPGAL
ncbi:DUF6653 family protein [uncultured Roseobacter sp.]|uniref:DUF6653 family protein n=1 Tax=uncultured Roseobacter sp. TaxID=114847 RepID=UPI00261F7AE3|nr:DUF6653 family protein [uncultured Roseobacter sp.]